MSISSPPTYRSGKPSSILTKNKEFQDGLTRSALSFLKVAGVEETTHTTSSEATPLLRPAEKRRPRASLAMAILVGVSFIIVVPIISLMLWGPYLCGGVIVERRRWEQEQEEHHLDEHSTWEHQFEEKQRQESARQYDWERELAASHLDEQLRMDRSERQLKKKQRQEKAKQDEWIEREEQQRLREHLREKQGLREEEERQRLGLYWADLEEDTRCTAYNTRDYKARLLNTVPYEYNRLRPCEEIPIVIHGRSIRTTRCEIDQDVSYFVRSFRSRNLH